MTIFSVADETRRQAREGKEKGVPSSREPLPKIEAETGYYRDTFVAGGSDGNTSGSEDGETTETQENAENETDSGSTASGGVTFNGDDPSTFAQEGGGATTSANDLEDSTSAPEDGDCIGCDVQKLDDITEGDCANTDGDSGDCFTIHYDGQYPIPDGWDDADTPGIEPSYINDKYWSWTGNTAPSGAALFTYMKPGLEASANTNNVTYSHSEYDGGTSGRVYYSWTYDDGLPSPVASLGCYVLSCGAEDGTYRCPAEGDAPLATDWPYDGCYELIFDGVAFKGNDYDPSLPDKYKGDGTSYVEYCTSNSTDGATRTGVDGGYQIDTTSMLRYYNSDGRLVAAGDKTQAFREQWQP